MDGFMNPQRSQKKQAADNQWGFIESALVSRHSPEVGPHPIHIKCNNCEKMTTSRIECETYSKTHFCAAALVMTIVCCPLACLVYLLDTWKRKHHYCSHCNQWLGTYDG